MNSNHSLPDRLKAASPGLGEASGTEVERRAIELAQMDGRDAFTDADLVRAAAELGGSDAAPLPPEVVAPEIGELTAWDDPVGQDGHRAERHPLDDESTIGERLVRDGIEEADHDRRVSAADDADAG